MSSVKIAKTITQGDTFKAGLTISRTVAQVTNPVDLTGVTITSQVRKANGELVADLAITAVNLANGQVQVRGESKDSDAGVGVPWPCGVLLWSVQFVENGDTWSMPTRGIQVDGDTTL